MLCSMEMILWTRVRGQDFADTILRIPLCRRSQAGYYGQVVVNTILRKHYTDGILTGYYRRDLVERICVYYVQILPRSPALIS